MLSLSFVLHSATVDRIVVARYRKARYSSNFINITSVSIQPSIRAVVIFRCEIHSHISCTERIIRDSVHKFCNTLQHEVPLVGAGRIRLRGLR